MVSAQGEIIDTH